MVTNPLPPSRGDVRCLGAPLARAQSLPASSGDVERLNPRPEVLRRLTAGSALQEADPQGPRARRCVCPAQSLSCFYWSNAAAGGRAPEKAHHPVLRQGFGPCVRSFTASHADGALGVPRRDRCVDLTQVLNGSTLVRRDRFLARRRVNRSGGEGLFLLRDARRWSRRRTRPCGHCLTRLPMAPLRPNLFRNAPSSSRSRIPKTLHQSSCSPRRRET
jgi:hypothetical protein